MLGEIHALSKPVTSNSTPTPKESEVVKNYKVIAPGMFRINPFKTSREEKHVPNKVRASARIKPITISQPPVITKKDVNSDSNGLSSIGLDNTKTRRPQPRSNTKNDRVPSASKSSRSKNKGAEQCLISINHDVCLRNYVNGKNSRGKKQKANVSTKEKQKKHQPKVKKSKKVGFIERLATPKPSKPRFLLRWSLTGRLFDQKGKIVDFSESESQSDCSNGDNACTSNTLEPKIKWFPNSTSFLGRLSRFVYGASTQGNILITRVYFVEGLGHNLFSVGQLCDSDLEVAFRRNACFVKNLDEVDLLKGLDLTYAPLTITTQQPTEGELDLLFEAMYDDYIGGQPSATARIVPAAQEPQVRQTSMTSTSIADTAPTTTNLSSRVTNFPNTLQDVDELNLQQQHASQQGI
nr:integrase, catalytic region, zinc finger, CCHC-type, peptidase aspartic, catalytic [Tanacetum cinerariifolium]